MPWVGAALVSSHNPSGARLSGVASTPRIRPGGQFYWPSVGTFVAAHGQFFMAANTGCPGSVGHSYAMLRQQVKNMVGERDSRLFRHPPRRSETVQPGHPTGTPTSVDNIIGIPSDYRARSGPIQPLLRKGPRAHNRLRRSFVAYFLRRLHVPGPPGGPGLRRTQLRELRQQGKQRATWRYSDLLAGLPRHPTNVLASRLKELEEVGEVRTGRWSTGRRRGPRNSRPHPTPWAAGVLLAGHQFTRE